MDRTNGELSTVFERLSSGQRINRASDDAAGLSIATSLNSKARVLSQGLRNINDGISLASIAEGALSSLSEIITRVGELANQAANGTFSARQRVALDREADSLLREYNRIIEGTSFNGLNILDGSDDSVTLQHGFGDAQSTRLDIGAQIGRAAGDGTFGSRVTIYTTSVPYDVTVADLNRDNIADIISADAAGGTVSVALGNGNGTFRARASFRSGGVPQSVIAADFNGDNILDLASVDPTSDPGANPSTIYVLLGNGNGSFRAPGAFDTAIGTFSSNVVASDVNSDGILDLVTSDSSSSSVSVFIGNGNGTFRSSSSYAAGSFPSELALNDLNGDGTVDIALADASGRVQVLIGNGNGTFSARRSYTAGNSAQTVALGDLNGDGILDVVTGDFDDSTSSVLIGNGDGTFRARQSFATGSSPFTLKLADINGDSRIDIITTNDGASTTTISLGNGNGTFRAGLSFGTGDNPYGLTVADMNGDGVLDILTADAGTNAISLLLGNADSTGRRNNYVYSVDLLSIQGARQALDWSTTQQTNISRELGMLGAYQSRLQATLSVISESHTNSLAASSRIIDADMASESAHLIRNQILQKAAQAVLSQSNLQPQLAVQLLRQR